MNPIRTTIVGAGKVAHTHAQALSTLPQSRLVAVCDRDQARASNFATQYTIYPSSDLVKMISDLAVEMVSICTPHPLHAEQAIIAARAGAHVLVEKPMALSVAHCNRMVVAAMQSAVQLGVISQRRLYPPVQRIRAAINSGKLGMPILGNVTLLGWRSAEYHAMDSWRGTWSGEGGGVLVNQAVHHLDLLQWFMGPIAEVFGYWANFNHPTIEVEDTAVAVIRFSTGALGTVMVSNSQKPGLFGRIHIHGDNGASVGVQTDSGSAYISGVTTAVEPPFNDIWTVSGEADLLARWQAEDRAAATTIDLMTYYHTLQIEDFLQSIVDDRPPLVTGDEGRKSIQLIEAIYRSQKSHQAVRNLAEPP